MTEDELKAALEAMARRLGVRPENGAAAEFERSAAAMYQKWNSTPVRRARSVKLPPEDRGE